ncbi:MAG TPA: hypothetical protein VK054_02520, partial [Beutenbergiaceae bacterium]|nr:hypothetical protein [Beutenbergiaceae bacterium]
MADSETNLIAGAVDLSTGLFYFGGYMSNGDFKIFEYNPNTNTLSVKGIVETENTGIASGDIDFDAAGNLFIVSGSAGKTKIYSVTRTDFEAANGGPIPSSVSAEVDAMASVAGVAFDASGKVFLSAQQEVRSYDMPDWSNAQTVATGDDGLHISTDLAGCSSPPSITIEKYVEGGRVDDTDQFDLTLHHGSQLLGEATTQGDATGVQSQRIGPLPTLRNVQLRFEETGAGTTDLDNYVTSYRCLVDGVQQTQGNATTGSVTIPTGGDVVECRLHNSPLIANVNIHKDLVDTKGENPTPAHDWTVGLGTTPSTGTVTPEPASPTQTIDSSGDAAWELRFNNFQDRATVAVSETQEDGYEFESATCVITHLDGTTTTHDLPSESAYDVDGVAPGDHMECVYTNKQLPGSVV